MSAQHDLVPTLRIVLAIPATADMNLGTRRTALPVRNPHVAYQGMGVQGICFVVSKDQPSLAILHPTSEQRHGDDAAGEHHPDRGAVDVDLLYRAGSQQACALHEQCRRAVVTTGWPSNPDYSGRSVT
ncbi:MAG: hypothetical protein F4X97_13910 [Boseongicola sp. SB0662_bin_57]|nr:hypothetical protein [Boseongicola sp. SB0662_bin_57]